MKPLKKILGEIAVMVSTVIANGEAEAEQYDTQARERAAVGDHAAARNLRECAEECRESLRPFYALRESVAAALSEEGDGI